MTQFEPALPQMLTCNTSTTLGGKGNNLILAYRNSAKNRTPSYGFAV
jgi:hypothetical protein